MTARRTNRRRPVQQKTARPGNIWSTVVSGKRTPGRGATGAKALLGGLSSGSWSPWPRISAGGRVRPWGYLLAKTSATGENQAVEHLSRERLAAGLARIRDSPQDGGRLVLIVRRPAVGERARPTEAVLDQVAGLDGDNWLARGSRSTPDGSADPQRQVTVMNARVAELVAGGTARMPLAGDQLYLDLDLSLGNFPAGSLLAVGQAVLQVSEAPHLGCAKFVERFGAEAMRFVNSRVGRQLRLRGMNAHVVVPGTVRLGDLAGKLPPGWAQPRPADCPPVPRRDPEIIAPARGHELRSDAGVASHSHAYRAPDPA